MAEQLIDEQGRPYVLDLYGNRVYHDGRGTGTASGEPQYIPGASMGGMYSSGRGNGGGGILPGEGGVGGWDGVVGGGTLAPVSDLAAEPPPPTDAPAAGTGGPTPVTSWEDGSALMSDGRVRDAETGALRDPILAAPADPGTIGGKFGTGTSVSPTTGKSRSAFSEMLHADVLGGAKSLRQGMADLNPMFAPYNPQPAAAPADPLAALAPPPGMPGFGAAPAGGPAASTATTPGLVGQPGSAGIPPLPEDPLPTAVAPPAPPAALPPAGSDIGMGAPPVPGPDPLAYGMGAPYASPASPAAMGMAAPLGMAPPPDPALAGGPPPVPAGLPPMPPELAARIGRTRMA